MTRTRQLQETRKMHFENVLNIWSKGNLTQEEATRILSVSDRTLRRYTDRYNDDGLNGLNDKRLMQVSACKAPVDEVLALVDRYELTT